MPNPHEQLSALWQQDYREAREKYLTGHCMFLAAALHHAYGLPIEAVWIDCNEAHEDPLVELREFDVFHCWVVLPGGRRFDIKGLQTYEEITRESIGHGKRHRWLPQLGTVTIDELARLSSEPSLPAEREDVQEALRIFNSIPPLVGMFECALEQDTTCGSESENNDVGTNE